MMHGNKKQPTHHKVAPMFFEHAVQYDSRGHKDASSLTTQTDFLTTNTSPVAMSLSTTNQGSFSPPILALWPSVRVNQPGRTETHRKMTREVIFEQKFRRHTHEDR